MLDGNELVKIKQGVNYYIERNTVVKVMVAGKFM